MRPSKPAPRHAAPGGFSTRRVVALPGLLLTVAGTAFAGLAMLPAASPGGAPDTMVTAAEALAPVEVAAPAVANRELAAALELGRKAATAPAPQRKPAAATRSRTAPKPAAKAQAPVAAFARPGDGRRTSPFGRRWGRLHAGVDLAAGTGSPIRAVEKATVLSAGTESGYGKCVRLRHADGTVTVYAHMSALLVQTGERVDAGQQIGREGNTGRSTGPHLHFEVRVNGTPVNPAAWLRKRGISV